jgi:hypothetical protein
MTRLSEGSIPVTDKERAELDRLENVVGYTRDGESLVVTLVDGTEARIGG